MATSRATSEPNELLVVSLGTGQHEIGQEQSKVRRWGRLGWVWPRPDPALVAAFLDGQSDAADHWAEVLLNHEPGRAVPEPSEQGKGPRYFRFQVTLPRGTSLDDASERSLAELSEAADRLLVKSDAELRELARRLARLEPLAADPAGVSPLGALERRRGTTWRTPSSARSSPAAPIQTIGSSTENSSSWLPR